MCHPLEAPALFPQHPAQLTLDGGGAGNLGPPLARGPCRSGERMVLIAFYRAVSADS